MGFPCLWMGSPCYPARVNTPDRQSKHQQAHPQPKGNQLLTEFIITQKIQTAAVENPTLLLILLSKCTSSAAHPVIPCLIPFFCHRLCFMGKHENSSFPGRAFLQPQEQQELQQKIKTTPSFLSLNCSILLGWQQFQLPALNALSYFPIPREN